MKEPKGIWSIIGLVLIGIFFVIYLLVCLVVLNSSVNREAITLNEKYNGNQDGYLKTNIVTPDSVSIVEKDLDIDETLTTFDDVDGHITEVKNEVDNKNKQNQPKQQHLFDYINSPQSLSPFNFDKCQMSNCFDYSRCLKDNNTMKVYIVPSNVETIESSSDNNTILTDLGESNIIHRNILKIIRESRYYEADPEKACLFVLEDDTLDRDPLSSSFKQNLPPSLISRENFYGINHLVFNLYSGTWPDYKENDFAGLQFGAAIIAKASNSKQIHRPNFDVSLPLFSYEHPYEDQDDDDEDKDKNKDKDKDQKVTSEISLDGSPDNNTLNNQINKNQSKSFFLTFKGKRYVIGSGSRTRNSLYHLNNDRDVIMLTTCRHGRRWRELSDIRCSEDESKYDKYDFVDLMKESTFCLVPRGRRLGSFRFLEALSYGCVPVIMSDGWVNPFDEMIDWSTASIQFDEDLVLIVPDLLRDIDEESISRMQRNCSILYKKYFSSTKRIILSVLSIIEQRILKNK